MIAHGLVEDLVGELDACGLTFHNHQRLALLAEDDGIATLVHAIHLDGILHRQQARRHVQLLHQKIQHLLPDFLFRRQQDIFLAQRVEDVGLAFARFGFEPKQGVVAHQLGSFCADKNKKYYLCLKFPAMKKYILSFFALVMLLAACTEEPDSIIGTWMVDKVNVQFDENRSTPELVKQVGEMEKQNLIFINSDSILVFKSLDDDMRGRLSLSSGGVMRVDGLVFGQWKEGQIVTRNDSPLGEIVVVYRK